MYSFEIPVLFKNGEVKICMIVVGPTNEWTTRIGKGEQ